MSRALYVDIDLVHLNPTASYYPHLIEAAVPNVTFYGPGFSSPEVLGKGLASWIKETGPYDMLFIGPNSPILVERLSDEVIHSTLAYMRRFTAFASTEAQAVDFLKELFAVLPGLDIPHRIASSLNFDYYGATPDQVKRLQDWDLTLIGPNEQFIQPLAELPDFVKQEKHYQRKQARLSDCWFDFLHAHPERVITATHFVVPSEFCYTPIAARRPVIAVPGVEYFLRKEANAALRQSGMRTASKWYFNLFRVLDRLGVRPYGSTLGLHLYNQSFQRTLKTSRYVYTARGGFGLPVRKFFEVPAAGTLMLCSPCTGYEDLGFIDGEHYHAVEPHELPVFLQDLTRSGAGHEVAAAGRKVAANNHSLESRARQVARCLAAITNGTYSGARWQKGEFVLIGESPSAA